MFLVVEMYMNKTKYLKIEKVYTTQMSGINTNNYKYRYVFVYI